MRNEKKINFFQVRIMIISETFVISTNITSEPPGMDWEYFSIPNIREVRYVDHGNNEYELVCLVSK